VPPHENSPYAGSLFSTFSLSFDLCVVTGPETIRIPPFSPSDHWLSTEFLHRSRRRNLWSYSSINTGKNGKKG
jgi:hypothetical protein